MSLCIDCKKRDCCTSLCQKAEKYVNQDYVGPSEILATAIDFNIENLSVDTCPVEVIELCEYFKIKETTSFPCLTPLQNKIAWAFYIHNMTYKSIARAMSGNRSKTKINQRAVKHHLSRVRLLLGAHISL